VVANAAYRSGWFGRSGERGVSNQSDSSSYQRLFDSNRNVASYSFYPPRRAASPTPETDRPVRRAFLLRTRPGTFPFLWVPCAIPAAATAYSLNVTAVPDTDYLGYLSTWPTGSAQPLVSTLNSWTGK